jgi:hypothetical protein
MIRTTSSTDPRAAIIRCCNGKQKTCLGFVWKYKDRESKHTGIPEGEYRTLEDYPTYYVYNDGRIYNTKTKILLKHVEMKGDRSRHYVTFRKDNKSKNFYVANLVATLWVPNPENKSNAVRKNGDNYNADNLMWK